MKAVLSLEFVGYNADQALRHFNCVADATGLPGRRESAGLRPWVAEVTGVDSVFGLKRSFVDGRIDFAESNGKMSRGVMLHFVLESGRCYEVKARRSWSSWDRYFCHVTDDGDIERIDKEAVLAWAKSESE